MRRLVTTTAVALTLLASAPTLAHAESPHWTITSVSRPTNFKPGDESGEDVYIVFLTNTGGASSDGSPVVITDELPTGLSLDLTGASGEDELAELQGRPTGANFSCMLRACTYTGTVIPDQTLVLTFPVDVAKTAPPEVTNVVRVSGGGARSASVSTPTIISATEEASFGISPGGATTALSTNQAGAHSDLTTSIVFNTVDRRGALAAAPKDTIDDLPPGFTLDLVDTPSCSAAEFLLSKCPIDTQVGVTTIEVDLQAQPTTHPRVSPVYNLAPNPGEVAKLGFLVAGAGIEGGISLSPDYRGRATFENISQGLGAELDNVSLTLWGVPADPIHDPWRWEPKPEPPNNLEAGKFGTSSQAARTPFSTNPTSCGSEPLEAVFTTDSWDQPGHSVGARMAFGPLVGCDRLAMEPKLTVEATTNRAYSPSGLALGMTVPQTYENGYGLATSTLRSAVVTLPEGMTVNPSAGAGLGACTEEQYAQEAAQFTSGSGCPNESKLGEVSIVSPAIKEQVTGSVYIAQPYANPFKSLLALYIVARLPARGIIVKTAGEVSADPLTGRLVTTFENLPPLPFSTFTFKFHSGATAPLVTPAACGNYTVQAELTPWAMPTQTLAPPIPPFPISASCPAGGAPPFSPQVAAGTENNAGGSYSPLYLRISRNDGEQEITGLSTSLPPGLTGNLSGIPFCGEAEIQRAREQSGAQAEATPACPAASQIGRSIAEAGVGTVLAQTPGQLYLGGPFEGAPFSVVSVTSAKVGPFDLGTVVVHLPVHIDPVTAQVSIPSGPADQIPHIIKGIVIHLRTIRVYIDRSNFTLNPTSCERQTFAATVSGSGADFTNPADDVRVTVNEPFQVADCQALKFKPIFKVSTEGKTSRKKGASLTAKLTYPNAPQGSQANIRAVKVDLPKQLPSRLTTLQKACPYSIFSANPAECPPASRVGQAIAVTPIIPVPSTGPAYFVSHGGAKFPELIIVLQGYGVRIDLHGETFINKAGITSSTFRTVPDLPVTSFELTLPEGPNSALAANANLCKVKGGLKMPTAFIAQNGAIIHRSTQITVTGCPKRVRHERRNLRKKK